MTLNSCAAQREQLHATSADLSILNKMLLSFIPKGHRWFYIHLPIHFRSLPIEILPSSSPKETQALGVCRVVITVFSQTHPIQSNFFRRTDSANRIPLCNLSKWVFTCRLRLTPKYVGKEKTLQDYFLSEKPRRLVLFFLPNWK